ncbi:hypothetical protein F3157_21660 [Virgibacillus dakarensis]|nr:hypothetical protein [Virgibacillus dakarensis]
MQKKLCSWYIHLLIFVSAQVAFFIFDHYPDWHLFNLNPLGEWVKGNFLNHLGGWVQIYKIEQFNWITVFWGIGIVLIIDGLISFSYTIWQSKKSSSTGTQ